MKIFNFFISNFKNENFQFFSFQIFAAYFNFFSFPSGGMANSFQISISFFFCNFFHFLLLVGSMMNLFLSIERLPH
jgi:hypothetical protein